MRAPWTAIVLLGGALTGPFASAGCQSILGIHDSHMAAADAAADVPEDRSDDQSNATTDVAASGGVPGGSGGGGGAAGSNIGGTAGQAPGTGDDGGTLDAQAPDAAGLDATAGQGGATGGGATDAGSAGGAGGRGGSSGGVACTSPWRADNVEARLLTPNTSSMTACSLAGSAVPKLAAAVDVVNFRGAQACGACLRVENMLGTTSVVVPVVEKSGADGVLLTKAAMDQISPGASLIKVNWMLVPCDVQDQPVRYYIKEGSNSGYVGIQIRNARYPVATVSAVGSKTSVALALQSYNYWESTAVGGGPLTLRLTDINGQSFDDPGVKIAPQVEAAGQGQFPLCR